VEFPREEPEPASDSKPPDFPEKCIRGSAKRWVETLHERGEWPVAFLFAEWRQIHSMLMGRSVGFGRGQPRFAHCHDLLIGESGLSHKGTSIHRARVVIGIARPTVLVCNNVSSIEGVLDQMNESTIGDEKVTRPLCLIAASEYSYLVATSRRQGTSNILPVLNDGYDGVDPLTITRRNAPIIHGPFLNLMAGCTPEWITSYADKEGADLGRFNRCVIFYTTQDRDISDPDYLTRGECEDFANTFSANIEKTLTHISNQPATVEFDEEAREYFKDWFIQFRARLRCLPDNLRKLFERDDDQVRIQAMMYAVAEGRRVAVKVEVEAAIELIEWSGKNKLKLFAEVEFNEDQRLERLMRRFLDRGGGNLKQLYSYLGSKTGSAEAVHRKLKAFAALGICALSRGIDQPSRDPLYIRPPAQS
jgi:hypothetical protein